MGNIVPYEATGVLENYEFAKQAGARFVHWWLEKEDLPLMRKVFSQSK